MLVVKLLAGGPASDLVGRRLREVTLPDGTLIAMVRRAGDLIIPSGSTSLEEGDRLTVIGRAEGISQLRHTYHETALRAGA